MIVLMIVAVGVAFAIGATGFVLEARRKRFEAAKHPVGPNVQEGD